MTSFINLISEKHKFRASRAFKLRKRGGERKLIRRNKTDRQEKKQVSKFNKLKEQIETSAKVSKVISCASPLEFRTQECLELCSDLFRYSGFNMGIFHQILPKTNDLSCHPHSFCTTAIFSCMLNFYYFFLMKVEDLCVLIVLNATV